MDAALLKQFFDQQNKLIETLTARLAKVESSDKQSQSPSQTIDGITNSMTEFYFDPVAKITFDSWFKRYEDIFRSEFVNQSEEWKIRLLLRKLGPKEHEKYCNFILPKKPTDHSFEGTIKFLGEMFGDQSSLFNIRYQCLNLLKNDQEDFVTYAGTVNKECERFKLKDLTDDQFKTLMFICGLRSSKDAEIRTRLLSRLENEPNISLQAVANECQRLINLKHDTAMIQQDHKPAAIHTLQQVDQADKQHRQQKQQMIVAKKSPPSPCWNCGAWHFKEYCSYKQHRCRDCNEVGHKEGHCRIKRENPKNRAFQQARRVPERFRKNTSSFSLMSTFKLDASRRKFITVSINGQYVKMQLDTASDVTIISRRTWDLLGRPMLQRSSETATSACGGALNLSYKLTCCVSFQGKSICGTCYVVNQDLNLLGLDWIDDLGLTEIPLQKLCNHIDSIPEDQIDQNYTQTFVEEFPAVFEKELGCCTQATVSLKVKPGATAVFRNKRTVPYAAIPLVEAELKRLEELGVLSPITYSNWAAPIVVIKKANGSVRLCADFSTGLNSALEDHHYPLPVPSDLFTILNGGKYFAKLDLADAYLQVNVAEESRELLTINTHRGLYRYNRLPFGVKTAPAAFQQIMDTMLSGQEGVAAYLDDIIIVGKNLSQLKDRIRNVLNRIQEYGFRLRVEKCEMFLDRIKYLGFIFDEQGRRPDPENVAAIQKLTTPKDTSELRTFLGLISYYSVFLPRLYELRAPLNRLLQKDVRWCWTPDCEKAFRDLQKVLTSDLLLTHYDPEFHIKVAADASQNGVGAVILHQFPDGTEKAIMHAARTLTKAERNYSQIEKEALAIIFAVKNFTRWFMDDILRCKRIISRYLPCLDRRKEFLPALLVGYNVGLQHFWVTILILSTVEQKNLDRWTHCPGSLITVSQLARTR